MMRGVITESARSDISITGGFTDVANVHGHAAYAARHAAVGWLDCAAAAGSSARSARSATVGAEERGMVRGAWMAREACTLR